MTDHTVFPSVAPSVPPGVTRLPLIDWLRGAAVVAMVIYHFAWDLRFFDFIDADVVNDPAWRWFARSIAASFLTLVGVSLVIAHGHGLRRSLFLRRLAWVAGAAALVTVGTAYAFPDATVWFGILHCIALGSVLALPFLRLPPLAVLGAAAIAMILPSIASAEIFNAATFYPLGLRTVEPRTNDYVPLFPWFGFILAGIAIGRLAPADRWASRDLPSVISRPVRWLGRHSLPIYLIHQPVLIGALWLVTGLAARDVPAAQLAEFRDACVTQCRIANTGAEICRRYCSCAETELANNDLLRAAVLNRLTPANDDVVSGIIAYCRRETGIATPRP